MKRLTKVENLTRDSLNDHVSECRNQIFNVVPANNVPFTECYLRSSRELQDQYSSATLERDEFESRMVQSGKAYRNKVGQILFYSESNI